MNAAMSAYNNGEPITIWPPTTIRQTAQERLAELIRMGGAQWHRENNPDWRGNPWQDGILVDLDEDSVLDAIVACVVRHADPSGEGDEP